MISAISPLTSALQAIGSRTQAIANNVANVSTSDYQAERGAFVSQDPGGGVSYVALEAEGGVDLESEFVDLLAARTAYAAAAESFATITRTEQSVLDTLA